MKLLINVVQIIVMNWEQLILNEISFVWHKRTIIICHHSWVSVLHSNGYGELPHIKAFCCTVLWAIFATFFVWLNTIVLNSSNWPSLFWLSIWCIGISALDCGIKNGYKSGASLFCWWRTYIYLGVPSQNTANWLKEKQRQAKLQKTSEFLIWEQDAFQVLSWILCLNSKTPVLSSRQWGFAILS